MSTLVSDVITYARYIVQTDSNGLTDTIGLAFTNDALQDFTRQLIARDIDAAQTQETYCDLGTTGSFAWPADMYMLKTIELDYAGGGGSNYIQATQVDIANIQNPTSFSYLRLNQSVATPLFDNRGDTYEVFPTPTSTITNGIRLFYYLTPTEYATTSTAISYPQTLDYRCLAFKVAALFSASIDEYTDVELYETEYQKRVDTIIKILAPGSQQPVQVQPLSITGFEF